MTAGQLSRQVVSSLVVISLMTASTGCFGPFNMTRNVYHWNSNIKGSGEVNDKWMKEIVFFGMIVIPVYMFSALLDAFIFNAIQFWSGDNPIKLTYDADGNIHVVELGDTTISISWSEDHRSAALMYRQQGRMIKTATIVEAGSGFHLVEDGGSQIYLSEFSRDGSVNIVDGDCRLVDHVSFERLLQASNEVARSSS